MSQCLDQISDYRKVIHLARDFPWPLANRELVVCASAMLIKERKGVITIMRSINEER